VQALGRPEGLDAEAWRTNGGRVREREVLVPRLAAIFGQEDFQTWQDRLTSAGVPLGRVRGLTEVLADLKARNDGFRLQLTHASIGRLPMVGGAIVMDGERLASERAPCLADQHRAALLAEFAEAGTRKGDGAT
ncbi:MAG: CoA transferase, partial [Salinibacterium sp.]|nr:CoA transferase [Salinibacterium sp.]